jgi:hypothetical protein
MITEDQYLILEICRYGWPWNRRTAVLVQKKTSSIDLGNGAQCCAAHDAEWLDLDTGEPIQ